MRKYNFYAGPSTLPVEVLEELKEEIADYHGEGLSMIETSHRSPMYDRVHEETIELFHELMGIPENYKVLFIGGGATLQFGMVPMNLLKPGTVGEYVKSGSWAGKAISDARTIGQVRILWDGKDSGYTALPDPVSLKPGNDSAYLHVTSNETIGGVQWKTFPRTGEIPLVADMSSDILSRSFEVRNFGLIYAGAQKNIGPAGVTVVIIRDDLAAASPENLPAYLRYKIHAEKNSLYNTPPVFAIYAINKMLRWLKARGGVAGIEKLNTQKAEAIYSVIDGNPGFYSSPVEKSVRSHMNVVFRLPSEELEKEFITRAKDKGMLGLKGHRDVGGCRASLYNALPLEGARALADLMKDFAAEKG
ncbi:3-phosphoserine/phosphohydroxythreonine transaminase [Marispirochaeta aestuarii]|uniref:3-phosphoserine/phosphohydroxythreonine transaminase n=1 Tax=Marispirochaeta aestuarii TaxID=1963862 RepID=UPI002ABE51E7|nr:3-phosphoserine/phosphohydroxythreonine transaminase [Marispirochaeta aestuarii]